MASNTSQKASSKAARTSLRLDLEGIYDVEKLNGKSLTRLAQGEVSRLGVRALDPNVTITATKTDAFTDPDSDGRAAPGAAINYTVTISNTGTSDATGVTFSDVIDSNTNLINNSVNVSPLAVNDAYSAIGNTLLRVGGSADTANPEVFVNGGSVTANDREFLGDTFTLTPIVNGASANGGTVNLIADGTFTYLPPAGFIGTDTFTYTISDDGAVGSSALTGTGTVTITVSNRVWYVDGDAPAGGTGRSHHPYNTITISNLSGASGAGDVDAVNDIIYVRERTGDYNLNLTLENNQQLYGSGVPLVVGGFTLLGASSNTTWTNTLGDAITLASGNTVRGFTIGNTLGSDITGGAVGNLTVNTVTLNGQGRAFHVGTSGTLDVTIDSLTSTSGTNAVSLKTCNGNFTANGGSINGPTGDDFFVDGGNANITYPGNITNSTGRSVNISNKTGGTVALSGAISDTSTGINFSNNSTTTLNLTGGVTLNGAASLFNASGGGTLNLPGTNNTIGEGTAVAGGTALTISGTTIGASGVTFRKIAANGAASGIVLNNTGSGAFQVTGTGTTDGTGGTIQNTSGRGASFITASNITLKNINFTSAGTSDLDLVDNNLSVGDNLATNAAIHLVTVSTVAIDNVNITGSAEQGINGNTVSNFTLSNSSIANSGNGGDEDNIHFYNMSGTSAITDTTLTRTSGGGDDSLNLQMQSGTLALTISGGSATGTAGGVAQLGSGYLFGIRGTSIATINFNNASSTNNFSGGIVADVFDNANLDLNVINSTSSGNNDQLSVSAGDNSNVDLVATGNTLSSVATGDFVVIGLLGSAFDNGFTFDANISNNNISVANGLAADGMLINNAGGGLMRTLITGNTITYAGTQRAIMLQAGQDGPGALNATVTGNNIDVQLDGTGNAVNAIHATAALTDNTDGTIDGDGSSLCADIGGAGALRNTITHSQNVGAMAAGDIRVRQRFNGTMRLPGYGGGATDTAAVVTYLNGRNTIVTTSTASAFSTGFAGGAACSQPAFLRYAPGGEEAANAGTCGVDMPAATDITATDSVTLKTPANVAALDRSAASLMPLISQNGLLTQAQLDVLVQEAIARWEASGLSTEQSAALRKTQWKVTDLPGWYLGEANGHTFTLDSNAGGNQWFIDATPQGNEEFAGTTSQLMATQNGAALGRVDALTAVMHEMGHMLGLNDSYLKTDRESIMYGWLPLNERRLPTMGEAEGAIPNLYQGTHFIGAPITIGTLPVGKSLTVKFAAQITSIMPLAATQVENQGTVSGDNFSDVLTDDPSVGGSTDKTVTPLELNAAPVNTVPGAQSATEDTNKVISGISVSDVDAGTANITVTLGVTNGTLTLKTDVVNGLVAGEITNNGTNSVTATASLSKINATLANANGLTYAPTANFNGPATLTVTTNDNGNTGGGGAQQDIDNVTINVAAVNDEPAGANKTVTTLEDTAYTFTAADFGFTDPNDSPANTLLAVKITTLPGAGTLANNSVAVNAGDSVSVADINAGNLKFTPASNGNGAGYASFTFQVQDNGGTANGGVDLDQSANTITIDVTTVSDAPAGTNNTVTTLEDTAYTFTTADFGFTDPDDSPANALSAVKITTLPGAGTLANNSVAVNAGDSVSVADINAGNLKFTPASNGNGAGYASFTFQVQDNGSTANGGANLDASANTITVDVTAVNDEPSFTKGVDQTVFDDAGAQTINNWASNLSAGPANEAGQLLDFIVSNDTNGLFDAQPAIDANGTLTFTPKLDQSGTATVTVQIHDNGGTANSGDDTSDAQTFTITVNLSNATPVADDGTESTDEDTAKTITLGASDADMDALTYTITVSPTKGTLTNADDSAIVGNQPSTNQVKYTPNANYHGSDSFKFTVNDGNIDSNEATVSITVDPVADTPSVTNATTDEDVQTTSGLVISRNANDDAEVTHFKITGITNGTLYQNDGTTAINNNDFITFAEGNAGLKFTPSANFSGNGSFTVQASTDNTNDGLGGSTATATITVNAVADTPSVTNATTDEDTKTTSGLVISRNANDGAEVTHFKITSITNGTLYQNDGTTAISSGAFITFAQGNAGLKFMPNANYFGTGSFDVQASLSNTDAGLGGGTATATITVDPVADTPSVTNATTNEDVQTASGLVISPNANDSSEVTHFKITAITNGTLYQNDGTTPITNGAFITDIEGGAGLKFTPSANFSGTGSFTVQASTSNANAGLGGSTATATITINSRNDAPVLDDSGYVAATVHGQGSSITDILFYSSLGDAIITDADNDPEGIAITQVLTTNGTWQYSLNGGQTWLALGAVSASNARLLKSNGNTTRLRFLPKGAGGANYPNQLTFRAWDRTSGTEGALANTTLNGGATAFSSATENLNVLVPNDSAPPQVTINTPASNAVLKQMPAQATGTASDVGLVSSGIRSVTVRLYRNANPITGTAAGYWNGNLANPQFNATYNAAAHERPVALANGYASWTLALPPRSGSYFLIATAIDGVGKKTALSRSFSVNDGSPQVNITQPVSSQRYKSNQLPLATGTAYDDDAIVHVGVRLYRYANATTGTQEGFWNGNSANPQFAPVYNPAMHERPTTLNGANWSLALPALAAARYALIATAYDGANNSNYTSNSFFITDGTPKVTITSPQAGVSYPSGSGAGSLNAVTGTTSDTNAAGAPNGDGIVGVTVRLYRKATFGNSEGYWNGTAFTMPYNPVVHDRAASNTASGGAPAFSSWSRSLPPLNVGDYSVVAAAYDSLGNSSYASTGVQARTTAQSAALTQAAPGAGVSFTIVAAPTESSSKLSGAEAISSAGSITLTFSGVVPQGQFSVQVNGQAVKVSDVIRSASSLTLLLPKDSLQAGDEVQVTWPGGSISLAVK